MRPTERRSPHTPTANPSLPCELLRKVFHEVTREETDGLSVQYVRRMVPGHPSILDNHLSVPPRTALHARTQLALVCRAWWSAGIEDLYARVHIHRVDQLLSLVHTLESTRRRRNHEQATDDEYNDALEAHIGDAAGYGRWVRQLMMQIKQDDWKNTNRDNLRKLFAFCNNLRTLDMCVQTPWLSSTAHATDVAPVNQWFSVIRSMPMHVKHLAISASLLKVQHGDEERLGGHEIRLEGLVSLTLAISEDDDGYIRVNQSVDRFRLPNLRSLAIVIGHRWSAVQLERITEEWEMPGLRCLSVISGRMSSVFGQQSGMGVTESKECVDVVKFCASHGRALENLLVEEQAGNYFGFAELKELLRVCPELVTMSVPCHKAGLQRPVPSFSTNDDRSTSVLQHRHLRSVTFNMMDVSRRHVAKGSASSLVHEFAKREIFPSLDVVRVVNFQQQELRPLHRKRSMGELIEAWTNAFSGTPIRFEHLEDITMDTDIASG